MVYHIGYMVDDIIERGEQEMKEITIEVKKFSEKCPICGLVIMNNSPEAVKYNLKLHLEKHSKDSAQQE